MYSLKYQSNISCVVTPGMGVKELHKPCKRMSVLQNTK